MKQEVPHMKEEVRTSPLKANGLAEPVGMPAACDSSPAASPSHDERSSWEEDDPAWSSWRWAGTSWNGNWSWSWNGWGSGDWHKSDQDCWRPSEALPRKLSFGSWSPGTATAAVLNRMDTSDRTSDWQKVAEAIPAPACPAKAAAEETHVFVGLSCTGQALFVCKTVFLRAQQKA